MGSVGAAKKRMKALRNRLWLEDPRCCYCGKLTILPKAILDASTEASPSLPHNMATLEHLYNRHHPLRDTNKFDIACNECNGIKGFIESGISHESIDLQELKEKTIKRLMIINKMIEFEKEGT